MMNIKQKPTPNKYELHGEPSVIVLHTTLGSCRGAINWLTNDKRNNPTSAHFVIGRTGEVTQLAPLTMGTWHAGRVHNPSPRALAVLPKNRWGKLKNPNRRTISIEVVSGYDIDKDGLVENWEKLYTPQQAGICAELVVEYIELKTGLTYKDTHILTHRDITSYKPNLEVQRLMVLSEIKKRRMGTPTINKDEKIKEHAKAIINLLK